MSEATVVASLEIRVMRRREIEAFLPPAGSVLVSIREVDWTLPA